MAHRSTVIADLEQRLADLRAEEAAETVARGQARPPGIPATWKPILFQQAPAAFIVVGWLDPDFEASVFRTGGIAPPTRATGARVTP